MMTRRLLVVMALLLLGLSCGAAPCVGIGTRDCDGQRIQECTSTGWKDVEDCGSQDLRCNVGGFCGSGKVCCQL